MYLGEIARGIITALIDASPKPLLFKGKSTQVIDKHYGIDTSFMSAVESDWLGKDACPEYIRPPFAELDSDSLSANIKTRLEAIRRTIIKDLGFDTDQVSLKDAAVILAYFYVDNTHSCGRLSVGFVASWAAELLI